MILTTAPYVDSYKVVKTLDIISAECVLGMNLILVLVGLSDVIGGRSETSQSVLREARHTCLQELRKEAAEIGANAVIAVQMNYNEFSGEGKWVLFLVATGTAVILEKSASA